MATEQSSQISSSSSTENADSQTFCKTLNIPVQNTDIISKKRKLEAPGFLSLGLDDADDKTSVEDNMDISLDKLRFNDTSALTSNAMSASLTQMESSLITDNEYEPLRPRSREPKGAQFGSREPRWAQPGSFLSRLKRFRTNHKPKLDRSHSLSPTLLHSTIADTVQVANTPILSLPTMVPHNKPEVPPRIKFRECEVIREKPEPVQSDEMFIFFCKHLKNFPGWCPKENESTVSLSSVIKHCMRN